jgi:branched-chain amino acid transport system substrate-binding protein
MKRNSLRPALTRVALAVGLAAGALAGVATVSAQSAGKAAPPNIRISDNVVKIGLLHDMNSLYADVAGPGSVEAVKMAVEDFGGKVHGAPIEILVADHQNKADLAAAKAREWFDSQKMDILGDVGASATALAASEVARQRNKLALLTGPGASRITNEACNAVTIHYAWDTYALAQVVGRGVVKTGGDTWFFLTADYAFGHALEKDTGDVVKGEGGKVLGSVRHPLNTNDFSSFMLQAQSSKAKIIGLANAGGDTINAIKAANEFGLTKNQRLAGLLLFDNDIHAIGLPVAQGMLLASAFYWDMNDETRKWSRRFFERMKKMPNMLQAGVYSSTLHYLKAVQATGTDDTDAVNKWMRANPINDMFVKNGRIREDGRMMREMYLFEVKTPAESKYPWDYFKLRATVPAEQAFRPLSQSACPLVKK